MARHTLIGLWVTLLLARPAAPQAAELAGDPHADPQHPPAMVELTIPSAGSRMPALLYQANGAGPSKQLLAF